MKHLKLVKPGIEHEAAAFAYIAEFEKYKSKTDGSSYLDSFVGDYAGRLTKLDNRLDSAKLPPGKVLSSTFFVVKEDDYIIGMTSIRHTLNEALMKRGGHIAYGVRPTERGKGYANEILHLGLEKLDELGVDKALLTCDKSNLASVKTIQHNGGILENEYYDQKEGITRQRYWIDVKKSLTLSSPQTMPTTRLLKLTNPVNPECPLLRDSFLYQFIQIASKNAKFYDEFGMFDTGKIRTTDEVHNDENPTYAKAHINEQFATGILLYKKLVKSRADDTLLEAKGIVKTLLSALGLDEEVQYETSNFSYFHPKKQGKLMYQGKEIGRIGSFHPLTLKEHKLPENANTCFVELNQTTINELRNQTGEKTYTYETIQDQILWRDLSFVLDEQADFSELLKRVQSVPEIKDLEVFDLYQGENLPEGKKSLSLKIKLMGDGTMTTEQINEIMGKAIKKAESVGAKLRG